MPGRVGNADLYIGMVRKRKSLPRDSKGFEPIDTYLKEVEEDLKKSSSSGGESGEETDVEEEKRKEKEAREIKRQEREKRERERKAEEEREREKMAEKEREARVAQEAQKETESDKEERGQRRQGKRRSLRQRGVSATDTESSAEEAEAGGVAGGVVIPEAAAEVESDLTSLESGCEREGRRGRKKSTGAKRGRPPRKSAASLKTVAPPEEGGVERVPGGVGEREGRGGKVDGATLYSPQVIPTTSPARDTVKVGPVRLTFSASPSDDDQRRRKKKGRDNLTRTNRQSASRKTLIPTSSEPADPISVGESERASRTDGESPRNKRREKLTRNQFVIAHNSDASFNPKKTSMQVRRDGKRGGVVKERVTSVRRGRPVVLRDPESEEEEEDDELISLLGPSERVSRLVGLSKLGRSPRKRPELGRDEIETTDEEAPGRRQSQGKTALRRKSAIKSASPRTAATTSRKTGRSYRKSVVFNPHTTNLGSPEFPHTQPLGSPESDTAGSTGGVYDYIPSDEEDFTHSKSRLYSPRRKSILRKAAASARRGRKVSRGKGKEEEEGGSGVEPVGSGRKEIELEMGGDGEKVVRELSIRVNDISTGGQWFVPDDIGLTVSDKSPRSLQRLTRTGRRSAISSTHLSSVVAPPQPRRKRRPRELESTESLETRVEEEEHETRENDSGSPSGGASSPDEASTTSHRKSRRVSRAKETEEMKSTGRRASGRKSTKLTPSWRKQKNKMRATPPSDEVPTEEEEEERSTPVSKKQRVPTPEEDEGMQSGGALSLSSEEEEEEEEGGAQAHLVRSLGGRKYRRYVVEHRDTKTPGVRRSKRSRVAPVQHWKNEEPEYERRRSGVTLKGVLVPVERGERRVSRKRKVSPQVSLDPTPLVITDRHGVRREFDVVTHPSLCDRLNGQGKLADRTDDVIIIKLCSSSSTTCGLLELSYLAEKEKSTSSTHEVFFFVLKGKAKFLVGKQTYDLVAESQIRVPAGVTYAIKNMHRSLARLYFYCHLVR